MSEKIFEKYSSITDEELHQVTGGDWISWLTAIGTAFNTTSYALMGHPKK